MKLRKHHNNKGLRQIKRGKTREQVKRIAKRLKIPYTYGLRIDWDYISPPSDGVD
jgi:hypothetical protein